MTATTRTWTDVCSVDDLIPGRGVAALVAGEQVAVFCLDGELYAIGNRDPFSGAYVMSRGIVGTKGGAPKVASPMYKQTFDLRTGVCFEQPDVAVPAWDVRCVGGRVEVADPPGSSPGGSPRAERGGRKDSRGAPTPLPSEQAPTR